MSRRGRGPLVAVDTKNFALYAGGIAALFRPLLEAWVQSRPSLQFVLMGPLYDWSAVTSLPHCHHHVIQWPTTVPRVLRHPFYDNVLFPLVVRRVKPDFLFSPYHDVRLPTTVPSTIMVHDTCLRDVGHLYSRGVRTYLESMLRLNLKRTSHVITVSETSRENIMRCYQIPSERITVIPNSVDPQFARRVDLRPKVTAVRQNRPGSPAIFYPSGSEQRKNVGALVRAVGVLLSYGHDPQLYVTGLRDRGWELAFQGLSSGLLDRIHFLGRLNIEELCASYLAADVVAYPSLCEGFGRVCLEAMESGTPLACSDLPVLREVAGDYPVYFNPMDVEQLADSIIKAAQAGPRAPRSDPRFSPTSVIQRFMATMDEILAAELGYA